MRFVVDEQLPPALARWIEGFGHDASHVSEMGLEAAKDRAIWSEAIRLNAVIMTKDEDFVQMSKRAGDGPQIVWITTGNTRRQHLINRMKTMFPKLLEALEAGERVVEVR
jgi:predicted nuclease of predicted toxin-antitoxin system